MKGVWRYAVSGVLSLALFGAAEQARAATVTLSPGSPAIGISTSNTYVYGDTTFTFGSCSSCGNLELVAIFNGRGGTKIEIEEKTSIQSYIFSKNSSSQSLSFVLTVGMNIGNQGIGSVTNVVNGNDGGTTSNDSKVTSVLSSILNTGTIGGGSLTSQLNETPVPAVTWPIQTTSFSFKDTLTQSSYTGASTLQLTNVQLLFNPAPEPASIELVAVGMVGLTAVRRRSAARAKG